MEAAAEDGAKKKTWWFPTADQRIGAAQAMARKIMPDLKSVGVSTDEEAPFVFQFIASRVLPAAM